MSGRVLLNNGENEMLILNRRFDQWIVIDGGIVVTILGCDRRTGRVRIGVDAPGGVSVDREEVAIQKGKPRTPRKGRREWV